MLLKQRIQLSVRLIIVLAAIMSVFAVGIKQVSAAEKVNSANTLKVSPVRTDIEINPGESKTIKVSVTNLTKEAITVRPIENDFIAGDERGTPALILDADESAPTHSLKKFLKPLSDVAIPAGKMQSVDVVITVPKNAQAGGYFGAIRFAPATPDSGGEVNLSASVASLILLTVPGPTTEKLDLTDFQIQQKGANGTIFRTPDDLQLTVRFASSSNVQVAPFGKISVKKGDKTVYQADFNQNDPRDMILPDSARRWDVPLKNVEGFFGHYTVFATLTYGKTNQTVEVKKDFWIISWAAIAVAGGALFTLVVIVLVTTLLMRRRSHRKVRSHSNNSSGYRR